MNIRTFRVLFFILFFLILFETAAEVRAYFRGYNTILFGRNIPESNLDNPKPNSQIYGPTDSFPFRSSIISKEKTSETIRIWIASSSYSEDIYLPADKIYPNLLEKLLNNSSNKFEILNAARAGENIFRNSQKIQAIGPQWKPDYALLYQMSLEMILISRILYGDRQSPLSINENDEIPASQKMSWAQRLVEESTIYAHLKEYLTSVLKRSRILHDSMGDEGDREFQRILNYFIEVCRKQDIQPILCTFATSHIRSDISSLPLAIRNWMFLYNDISQ